MSGSGWPVDRPGASTPGTVAPGTVAPGTVTPGSGAPGSGAFGDGVQLLVIAKTPVPGRVKTRLCPPCTPRAAAWLAEAALADTLAAVGAAPAAGRTLVIEGSYPAPPGWARVTQRGDGLGERLRHAYADAVRPGRPSLLIGMDTPQVTPALLAGAARTLADDGVDAVLGPAPDGGWWALGLRDPAHAAVLPGITMSTSDTGARTLAALHARGLRVAVLPVLRDVDTAADAHAVAARCAPGGRFAPAVARLIPKPAAPTGVTPAEARLIPKPAAPTGVTPAEAGLIPRPVAP